MNTKRRALLVALAATPVGAALPELGERQRVEDFDELWGAIDQGYAYFGSARGEWSRVREPGRAKVRAARSRAAFAAALEDALNRLHEDHLWMSEHSPGAARRVPSETDIWASWRNDAAVIEAVRTYGDADVAGLRPGHVVRSIAGTPATLAMRDWIGRRENEAGSRDWALRHALAGPREGILRLEVAEAQGPRAYDIERSSRSPAPTPPVIARRVGEQRDAGYLRIKAALSDATLAHRFDGAMHHLNGTRAMILDLRDLTGPFGDPARSRATTLAILQRFATRPGPWQAREPRPGERVEDAMRPEAGAYSAPLVVLVDRWTAGEGEALASGLQAVAGARLVGTRMAGLRGELRAVRLRHSGITVRFPAQKTFLADGAPRESLRPDILVDLAAPQGGPGDPILYQAIKLLEK